MFKIRKLKNTWEVRRTGKRWHIHTGRGLLRQIIRCLLFTKKRCQSRRDKLKSNKYNRHTCPKSDEWFTRGGRCGWGHECDFCTEVFHTDSDFVSDEDGGTGSQDVSFIEVQRFIDKSLFISHLLDSHSVYHDKVDEWNELLNKLSERMYRRK